MELQDAIATIEGAARPLAVHAYDLGAGADAIAVARAIDGAWLLLSAPEPSELSQHDLIGFAPYLTLRATGDAISLSTRCATCHGRGDALAVMQRLQNAFAGTRAPPGSPFAAGALGWFAYDLGRRFERLPVVARADLSFADLLVTWFAAYLVRSVRTGLWTLFTTAVPADLAGHDDRLARARAALAESTPTKPVPRLPLVEPSSTFTRDGYLHAVANLVAAIHRGDVFQVNLSQRFSGPARLDPHDLFAVLRELSPVPFAAFIDDGRRFVLSASPERFLKVSGRRVESWPIKGTVRRGRDPVADLAASAALLASVKDGAELAMIIDLERNDLGRVCEPGSIRVREAARLQTLRNVHHLCGIVEGDLLPGVQLADLLRAAFPGGSITGAPKLAAMQMIEQLEPVRRSVYTGSMGYLGFDGDLDLNIAIRTILIERGRAYLSVGGGIVADSDPRAEFEETLAKAEPLMRALGWRCAV